MEWRLTIKKVAEVTNGEIVGCDADEIVKDISKDSRNIIEGAIYIALKGDKYNGHTFVKTATESGAICSIVAEGEGDFSGCPIIRVKDTYKALRDIAEYYRTLFNIPIIGITGSVGKTSTKEMVASVLEKRYKTHKTAGNFNNEIGLPLTILGLSGDDEISVIEMGMSDFGEISRLTKIAKPDTAIITNIGVSHIEHLGSRENIKKAKFEILEGLPIDGTVIINGDDDMLYKAKDEIGFETLTFGIKNINSDIVAHNIKSYSDSSEFIVGIEGRDYKIFINAPGTHHIYNALAAILIGLKYNVNVDNIIKGIRDFTPSGLRQNVIRYENYTVIKDCYNASPTSMKAGLEVLSLLADGDGDRPRCVACLADMLELGDISKSEHLAIGNLVAESAVDCLITVGENGKYIASGAIENGMDSEEVHSFSNNSELIQELNNILKKGDMVLVKGSRGMRLEEIADYIGTI